MPRRPLPGGPVEDFVTQMKFTEIERTWPAIAETRTPTLLNGWATQGGFGATKVTKTSDGIVVINGVLTSAGAAAATAFTLDAGWRPTSAFLEGPLTYWAPGALVLGLYQVQGANGNVLLYSNAAAFIAKTDWTFNIVFSTNH